MRAASLTTLSFSKREQVSPERAVLYAREHGLGHFLLHLFSGTLRTYLAERLSSVSGGTGDDVEENRKEREEFAYIAEEESRAPSAFSLLPAEQMSVLKRVAAEQLQATKEYHAAGERLPRSSLTRPSLCSVRRRRAP